MTILIEILTVAMAVNIIIIIMSFNLSCNKKLNENYVRKKLKTTTKNSNTNLFFLLLIIKYSIFCSNNKWLN